MNPANLPLFEVSEVGTVRDIRYGIAKIDGLPSCVYGQLVQFPCGVKGMVMGYHPREALVIVLGETDRIGVGEQVTSLAEQAQVPVGEQFIGRIVNSLGEPLDGLDAIRSTGHGPVFRQAPGVMQREPISEPLETGIKIIDLTIPIGKGQRELIIGDRQTGKSSIGTDAIIHQRGREVVCIYCWIGGPQAALRKVVHLLRERHALEYTIILASPANSSAAEQYVAPYAAAALGEYFMDRGKDVLIVFDDLTKHAWVYRQMSLLLERPPGREAYPGDIFYLHSQLIERAGRMTTQRGGGSMTFLPIVETIQGDLTGYIQTNLISMTDGQIYVSAPLFHEGFKPAIDLGLSVSRIGSKAQTAAIREVGRGLRLEYARYRDMLRLTKLRTHLSNEALQQMRRGEALRELLTQPNGQPVPPEEMAVLFYAFSRNVLQTLPPEALRPFLDGCCSWLAGRHQPLMERLRTEREFTPPMREELDAALAEFVRGLAPCNAS